MILCSNGHFLGQGFVVAEFSSRIGIDLTAIDQDHQHTHEGSVRSSFFLSMIPATFGIWFDRWNVGGYLVKQRAELYAKQMGYPRVCEVCGVAHIPYQEIMRASSQQISLAYQVPANLKQHIWFVFGFAVVLLSLSLCYTLPF